MTPQDLQTCRAWCAANGVEIVQLWKPDGPYAVRTTTGFRNPYLPPLACETEVDLYETIWKHIAPIIQSVRNLDAVEVEGPWKPVKYYGSDRWWIDSDSVGSTVSTPSEQTARTIANLLNRECGK